MGQAVVRKDKKAEDAAITDYMRAEVRAWWQDFPDKGSSPTSIKRGRPAAGEIRLP